MKSRAPLESNTRLHTGCHRLVRFPIDASTERLAFEHFCARAADHGSPAHALLEDMVVHDRPSDAWRRSRGRPGSIAELEVPLVAVVRYEGVAYAIDSAQVLATIFDDAPSIELLTTVARFIAELLDVVAWWPAAGSLRELGIGLPSLVESARVAA